MVLVIVCALAFLSVAFAIRSALPLVTAAALPWISGPELPPPRALTFERKGSQGRSAPMAPADPVLAPAPYLPPAAPDQVNERVRMPHSPARGSFGCDV